MLQEKNRTLVNDFSLDIQRDSTSENLAEAPTLHQTCKTANGNAAKLSLTLSVDQSLPPGPQRQDSQVS